MDSFKRVSYWSVEDVYRWVKNQYPTGQAAFLQAINRHSISGRALLRISEPQLKRMGIELKQQQDILQDVLLLRVQEELENLNDIFSGVSMGYMSLDAKRREKVR